MAEAQIVVEESRLVEQAQHGDHQAYGELVFRYRSRVINVVYRMCGDPNLAEDAAQMAFIRAWQHLLDLRPGTSFRNWIYRIAVNAALDSLRRQKADCRASLTPLTAPSDSLDARLEQEERIQRIRRAVLALPPASRIVLILREYEGLSYHEISEALDLPSGTVMSRLNYARQRLAEQLKDLLEEQ